MVAVLFALRTLNGQVIGGVIQRTLEWLSVTVIGTSEERDRRSRD